MLNRRYIPFAAFTAVFAVLAAIVFWGTWSSSVGFVSPDDGQAFSLTYGDTVQRWWNNFLTTGKILPSDVFWAGLLGGPIFCRPLKYVSAIYCAGLALAWFLKGRGLSSFASYGAGLCLAFSGYWLTLFSAGHAGWFVWMTYGVFAFGLIDRMLSTGKLRYALLLGASVAWASFNQPDLWLIFTAFTAIYFVFRLVACLRDQGEASSLPRGISIRNLALAAVAFFLIGAPSFYSALTNDLAGRDKQIEESKGTSLGGNTQDDAETRWIFTTNWSLPPSETAEFIFSRLNGDTSCPLTLSINGKTKGTRLYTGALGRPYTASEGNYRQHSLYVGFFTVVLALLALRRPRPTVLFFALGALVFWLFSLGRYCEPVYRCVYALPFGDYLRAPVKWHHLTEFCLCVLAGYGLDLFRQGFRVLVERRLQTPGDRRPLIRACAVIALLVINLGGLARNAALYCAPIDYSQAIAKKCSSQLTILPRGEFADPQVQAMVRAGYIISVANWLGSPDAFLVQVLKPLKPVKPAESKPIPLTLGIVSLFSALGVLSAATFLRRAERDVV